MSSPKHLWSGDWERESPELKSSPAPRVDAIPISPPNPSKWPPRTPPTGSRRTALVIAAVVVVLAAVGVTLAATLGGSSSTTRTSAQSPFSQASSGGSPLQQQSPSLPNTTTPQATTPQGATSPQSAAPEGQPGGPSVTAGPTYNWLGMSIADIASGVSVETVSIGGAADTAGVNPGDVIVQIDHTGVDSVSQLRAALKHLKLGQSFQLVVDRGSTPVQLTATLTGRPTHS